MKISILYSPRISFKLQKNILRITQNLKKNGCTICFPSQIDFERINNCSKVEISIIFNNIVDQLRELDLIVIEASTHSLAMGYLLNTALSIGKPVIALYYKSVSKPVFVDGINDERLQLLEYDHSNLDSVIDNAIDYARDFQNVRYNFTLSSELYAYLELIAKNYQIPKSVFIRNLIVEHMKRMRQVI